MSAFLDRLAELDVPPAAVGGIPTDPAPQSVQEPPQFAGPAIGGAVRPRVPAPPRAPDSIPLYPPPLSCCGRMYAHALSCTVGLSWAPGELSEAFGK